MDEQPVLIVSPIDYAHSDGAVIITADCGHKAYISLGGIQSQAELGAKTMCMRCVNPKDVPELTITPAIYADLVAQVGQQAADQLVELSKNPAIRERVLGDHRG